MQFVAKAEIKTKAIGKAYGPNEMSG